MNPGDLVVGWTYQDGSGAVYTVQRAADFEVLVIVLRPIFCGVMERRAWKCLYEGKIVDLVDD